MLVARHTRLGRSSSRRRRVAGWLVAGSAAAGLLLLPAFVLAPEPPGWAPRPLVDYAFDLRLLLATHGKSLASLASGKLRDKRLELAPRSGEAVRIGGPDLALSGSLYRSRRAGPRPAVALLHGSSPKGRDLALYRVLAERLSDRGYHVLVLDQRGYGQSQDPPSDLDAKHFDYVGDVMRALAFLAAREEVDPERLHVIGHSFGADVALSSARRGVHARSIVAIGPSRLFRDRVGRPDAPWLDYFRRREMRYMDLASPPSVELFLAYRAELTLENHASYFARHDHLPVLLVDGELEGAARHAFLSRHYEAMGGPKRLLTLRDADHYANVADLGWLVVYDARVLSELVAAIEQWLSDHETGRQAQGATT